MKPVKLARCMTIPSPFRTPEHPNHSNLCTVTSMAQSRSLLIRGTAIGSHSSTISLASRQLVYLLKRKSETFAAFKQFKARAENVTGQKLGCLRDDKGGEYMSREFEAFCIDHGIQRQHSARNRPQQNGVAERANRTLEEGVISMLSESGTPPSFWGEALGSFAHVHNRAFAHGEVHLHCISSRI